MEVKQLTLADTINLGAKTRKKTKTQKRLDTITQLVNWSEITDICKDLYKSNTKKGGVLHYVLPLKLSCYFYSMFIICQMSA
ncbi:MAG: hypothetical protein QM528_08095 [Phycisphaerales bacterium]|nr:hypothetical protein [Phycisphaerales bacterium]